MFPGYGIVVTFLNSQQHWLPMWIWTRLGAWMLCPGRTPHPRISKQFMAAAVWKLFTLLQVTLIKLLVQPGRFGRNDLLYLPWDSIWQFQILWHKKCKLQWNTTIKLYKTYNFWIQIFKEREGGKNTKTPDKKFNRTENFEFLMQALQSMHVLIFFLNNPHKGHQCKVTDTID